jgi:hypothetical protein
VLYKDSGHSSLLHNIQEEPCDFRLREQPTCFCTPVTPQELLGVCVLMVSVFSVVNSMPEYHFELALSLVNVSAVIYSVQIYSFVRLYIIVAFCWQSWSGMSEGKAVVTDGGCCQLMREQVSWSIMIHVHSSAPHHLQGTPVLQVCVIWGTCWSLIWLFEWFLVTIKHVVQLRS